MKLLFTILKITLAGYLLICLLLYFFQEKLIFLPEQLSKDHSFNFDQAFEEISVNTADNKLLNAVLFKADSSKGVIFYLHGNAGSIDSWGDVAGTYTDLNYDVFMPDYRGYGKSEGNISGEQQIFDDVQAAYDFVKKRYSENKIVVLGYSIGTGLASKIVKTWAKKST